MEKIRIAVLCPAEIARRRFMPALAKESARFEYAGVGVATRAEFADGPAGSLPAGAAADFESLDAASWELARDMQQAWGAKVWAGYGALVADPHVDAVYLPLPPGLHAPWGRAVLASGKHLLMEKPFSTSAADTEGLVLLARSRDLAVHENYMFAFHAQIDFARTLIEEGRIGTPRLYRVDFGFPRRAANDFRYVRALGGGALLDCGGYALKLGTMLVGPGVQVVAASMAPDDASDVDLFGSATLEGLHGIAQVAWGMDNDYRCTLDVWGSEGSLSTNRILTAPEGFVPEFVIRKNGNAQIVEGPADDSFAKSIAHFGDLVCGRASRSEREQEIIRQAAMVDEVRRLAGA